MASSRVREFHLPITVFAGSALVGLALLIALALNDVELGLNLSFVGLLLGLIIPIGIEVRSRAGRTRTVLVLDYRVHQYGHAVARGVIRTLTNDKRRWKVNYSAPPATVTDDAPQWQARQVQEAVLDDMDAIVLIPSGDDEALWFAVASAIKARTFVVAVDTKPPNKVFRDVGIEPPRFVSANYPMTGVIVGELIADWLEAVADRTCILWIGPYGSWPGEERSRNVIFELSRRGLLERALLLPMESWVPDAERCRATLAHAEKCPGEVAIYTGDDENAVALHLLTLAEKPGMRQSLYIVGCNGTPDDWGSVPSVDMRAVDATVDILAEQQGVEVCKLMIKERHAKLGAAERSVYIKPHPLIRAELGKRWIDSLFESSPLTAHEGVGDAEAPT